MKLAKAWLWLSTIMVSAWATILVSIYFLEQVLSAFKDPLLRALLGIGLLSVWIILMAIVAETLRIKMGSSSPLPKKRAR